MSRNDIQFFGGTILVFAAFVLYVYVTRGTLWAIPTVLVAIAALGLVTIAHTREKYGGATRERVVAVVLYTIGFNIAGSLLFGLGTLLWRSTR